MSSKSIFGLPSQTAKAAATEPVTVTDITVASSETQIVSLAATQDLQSRQTSREDSDLLLSPAVENCLPSPNHLLTFTSLALVGVLGVGAVASTILTHDTVVQSQAVMVPVDEGQLIQSATGGIVETIAVQEYDSLDAGQIIAAIENPAIGLNVAQIKLQTVETEERIAQIDDQIRALEQRHLAETNLAKQLTAKGLQSSISQFKASKEILLNQRLSLNAQLSQERQQLEKAQQQVDSLTVRSPVDGTVYELELDRLGQNVGANQTIAKVIPAGAALAVKALVPDTYLEGIEEGHTARMALSDCAPLSFGHLEGQVRSIEPAVLLTQEGLPEKNIHMVMVETEAQALQSALRTCELLPGMQGELTIITKQEKLLNFFLRKLRLRIQQVA
ncbi:HlyD family efflux transporter periplasmic adaptor subunit [Leptolyngbya cf. ectocarpi LEGE 11479]|uniref:HlyD family efflux transporter periplasmic adaptor subunit n=1 Tax=Leptolyngbya cf. ectocarpi LEGE 11479 TaxID=1828722 RepID=A0A929F950_LEPEC|nr:HlyD family efflux transporter periplasmic adaptor subunit [Leptolyngbya ectocarpi]MBE9069665.1 HlyD family efflux transporter periplasmic adaptor subunit [Leptolyngbya cf. ectocarpi LEGE 11479]